MQKIVAYAVYFFFAIPVTTLTIAEWCGGKIEQAINAHPIAFCVLWWLALIVLPLGIGAACGLCLR